jgi:hypothetical protein
MMAFAHHRETPARQRQTERTALDNASSLLADDSYVMRLRNTTLDQPSLEHKINLAGCGKTILAR